MGDLSSRDQSLTSVELQKIKDLKFFLTLVAGGVVLRDLVSFNGSDGLFNL
jgi:hypothetical protein